jgi:hypothetical protein
LRAAVKLAREAERAGASPKKRGVARVTAREKRRTVESTPTSPHAEEVLGIHT